MPWNVDSRPPATARVSIRAFSTLYTFQSAHAASVKGTDAFFAKPASHPAETGQTRPSPAAQYPGAPTQQVLISFQFQTVCSKGRAVVLSRDRKSTRLNSSHLGISYAVFC